MCQALSAVCFTQRHDAVRVPNEEEAVVRPLVRKPQAGAGLNYPVSPGRSSGGWWRGFSALVGPQGWSCLRFLGLGRTTPDRDAKSRPPRMRVPEDIQAERGEEASFLLVPQRTRCGAPEHLAARTLLPSRWR